jgi:predicted DNA-binding protein (UPF0251 family)
MVSGYPTMAAFRPEGIPISGEIQISVENLEAVRLSDFEGLDQESAAQMMGVSRQTYGRILADARRKIAEAMVTGKLLRVSGGHFEVRSRPGGRRRRKGWGKHKP